MSLLTCCFWWFVLGLLLGWLLNWLLSKLLRKEPPATPHTATGASSARFATPAAAAPYIPSVPSAATAPIVPSASATPARGVDVGAARAAGFNLKHADDLTIIEGIGPKIDELFRSNGATTFQQVSRLSVGEMQAILDRGGPHFRMANPGTWAHQALLASENRWGELKQLQHELYGGVEPRENH